MNLTVKQQKLIDFINNYRKHNKLETINEFKNKEELDRYIKENYQKAKNNQAKSRANSFGYGNTSQGMLNRAVTYGKYAHTGTCKTYKNKEEYNKSKEKVM